MWTPALLGSPHLFFPICYEHASSVNIQQVWMCEGGAFYCSFWTSDVGKIGITHGKRWALVQSWKPNIRYHSNNGSHTHSIGSRFASSYLWHHFNGGSVLIVLCLDRACALYSMPLRARYKVMRSPQFLLAAVYLFPLLFFCVTSYVLQKQRSARFIRFHYLQHGWWQCKINTPGSLYDHHHSWR